VEQVRRKQTRMVWVRCNEGIPPLEESLING
jgi:hypothetical protein